MKVPVPVLVLFAAVALLHLLGKNEITAASVGHGPISTNIIGGVEAKKGEFPWIVLIRYRSDLAKSNKPVSGDPTMDWVCVGTIIQNNQIITAAHCVVGVPAKEITILAGAHNISKNEQSQQTVNVLRTYVHADYYEYDDGTSRNDIALLITEPLELNEFVSIVNLPPYLHEPTGSCWIAGWGQTSNSAGTETLHKADIPIVNKDKCKQIYEDKLDVSVHVCAGKEEGGTDACMFDTGGPLVCNDVGSNYIAGIVSWGYMCGKPLHPGVYTKVSQFVDWVRNSYIDYSHNFQ